MIYSSLTTRGNMVSEHFNELLFVESSASEVYSALAVVIITVV